MKRTCNLHIVNKNVAFCL